MDAEKDPFVEEAFQEISEEERKQIKADARVVAALRSKKVTLGKVLVGEEEISFRLSINKKLRRKLSLYKSKMSQGEPSVEEAERVLYEVLSSLCVNEPWTSAKTWSVFDDSADGEGAQEIIMLMLKQVNAHMEDVKNFR